jgi:hypothetical protein
MLSMLRGKLIIPSGSILQTAGHEAHEINTEKHTENLCETLCSLYLRGKLIIPSGNMLQTAGQEVHNPACRQLILT